MDTVAIIVAAGVGSRAGGEIPKQWQLLEGIPIVGHSVLRFAQCVDKIVLVIHPKHQSYADRLINNLALQTPVDLVHGGETRSRSVHNALEWLDGKAVSKVLIHDGARPLIPRRVIDDVINALNDSVGVAPALAVCDALWKGVNNIVTDTVSRDGLWRAQTPQGFRFHEILSAYRNPTTNVLTAADDVEIARLAGYNVTIITGDEDNLKITFPQDFIRAQNILHKEKKVPKMNMRVGNGFDVHAFCEGSHLWLCGVKIPHTRSLLGHSDADVGMHTLTDAIYGALGEGDIGVHFPPSDPQWRGAESHIFLRHAVTRAHERGYKIANCDITLICEEPKIGPHQEKMRQALASIMVIDRSRISVKATTSERLGFTGRKEGIAAMATVLLASET